MAEVFHEGERAVQARAGVEARARQVGESIDSTIPLMAEGFLLRQPMVVLGSRDASGRVWASLLTGDPGFAHALDERTVEISAQPLPEDPLSGILAAGDMEVGLLALEPVTRRRIRVNGRTIAGAAGTITIRTEQVYFNCPKYIQARGWMLAEASDPVAGRSKVLTEKQQQLIAAADTFFIASNHPTRGLDASHRGGNPGFIHVRDAHFLAWPDYNGNSMFQTLGNLEVDPAAGLLFFDYERGTTLQLTGKAKIVWDAATTARFPGAERVVEFKVEDVVEIENATALRGVLLEYSPFNPA